MKIFRFILMIPNKLLFFIYFINFFLYELGQYDDETEAEKMGQPEKKEKKKEKGAKIGDKKKITE